MPGIRPVSSSRLSAVALGSAFSDAANRLPYASASALDAVARMPEDEVCAAKIGKIGGE